jgi:hypothetical protein
MLWISFDQYSHFANRFFVGDRVYFMQYRWTPFIRVYWRRPRVTLSGYWNYIKYVVRHRWFVMLECFKYKLYWRGLVHDISKFTPIEFFPYARYFFGPSPRGQQTPEEIEDFNYATQIHRNRNPHHWQYWIQYDSAEKIRVLPMPERYLKEMVADWRGVAKALGTAGAVAWYKQNGPNIVLHPDTRRLLHQELGI